MKKTAKTTMASIKAEFGTLKLLLYKALSDFPETRNSDTLLYFKCCELLGAKTIEETKGLLLSVISVHKMRQVIQNKEGFFQPDEEVKKVRSERATVIKDYMVQNN